MHNIFSVHWLNVLWHVKGSPGHQRKRSLPYAQVLSAGVQGYARGGPQTPCTRFRVSHNMSELGTFLD